MADTSKQSMVGVADAAECENKCKESSDCIALHVTSGWSTNECYMFTDVTRFEDDASNTYSSKVFGCRRKLIVGSPLVVPCYLLEQEAKLTGTLYNMKIFYTL